MAWCGEPCRVVACEASRLPCYAVTQIIMARAIQGASPVSSAPQIFLATPLITPQEDIEARAAQLAAVLAAAPVAALRLRFDAQDERSLIKRVKPLVAVAQAAGAAAILEIVPAASRDGAPQGAPDLATVAVRAGADGVHLDDPARVAEMIGRFAGEKAVGLANPRNRHEAMEAGEAGIDYLAFGEPRRDGSVPDHVRACEQAAWWAEIFETPCAIFAPDRASIDAAIRTGAEFISLGDAVFADPAEAPQALSACAEAMTVSWQAWHIETGSA
jgi:thiamine-phosphate pyrophosphorylase